MKLLGHFKGNIKVTYDDVVHILVDRDSSVIFRRRSKGLVYSLRSTRTTRKSPSVNSTADDWLGDYAA